MSYFLSDKNLSLGSVTALEGEEAMHIMLSRRIKPGEHIFLQGPDGHRFEAEVVTLGKKILEVKPLMPAAAPPEPSVNITLFQSVVSEKALDFIFQKSTELGANKIVLFNSARTATKLFADQFNKKKPRWEKILWEAAKQSDRSRIPLLQFSPPFQEGVLPAEWREGYDKILILDPSGKKLAVQGSGPQPLALGLVIGPEGGFTAEEINLFKKLPNSEVVHLGPIILKAETAALAALAICQNLF